MTNNFRNDPPPKRTCKKNYINYKSFKNHLAFDFKNRCGYTNCNDFWFGGKNNFHIDHFIPWKKHPDRPSLKTDYSNLVYTCSYVNIIKSNDEGDYIDPCDVDYNLHFYRDNIGNILPYQKSSAANYMYNRLKLFMLRYQIIWMLDNLYAKMKKIKIAIEATADGDLKNNLLVTQGELSNLFIEYIEYLKKNQ